MCSAESAGTTRTPRQEREAFLNSQVNCLCVQFRETDIGVEDGESISVQDNNYVAAQIVRSAHKGNIPIPGSDRSFRKAGFYRDVQTDDPGTAVGCDPAAAHHSGIYDHIRAIGEADHGRFSRRSDDLGIFVLYGGQYLLGIFFYHNK